MGLRITGGVYQRYTQIIFQPTASEPRMKLDARLRWDDEPDDFGALIVELLVQPRPACAGG